MASTRQHNSTHKHNSYIPKRSFPNQRVNGDYLADGSGNKRLCPVCDEEVLIEAKVCPSCNTDLTLFAPEELSELPSDAEELKSQLLSDESKHVGDLLAVADEVDLAPLTSDDEYFNCPDCNARVPIDATSCPKCRIEFEFEEVFECPMCQEHIDVNVNKCPKCGAEFADEAPTEEKPKPKKPAEPAKPVSFADRMKQMKEQPEEKQAATQEKAAEKPLSFADRMRALKDDEGKPKVAASAAKPSAKPVSPGAKTSAARPMPEVKSPAKEDEYKELPKLIGVVKRLLVIAKESDIDVTKSKMLISQAVSASKKKDLENAISLIREGKSGLEKDLRTLIMGKHRTFSSAASLAKKGGKDTSAIERILDSIKKSVEADDYSTAVGECRRAEGMVEGLSGATAIAQAEIGVIERTIRDALALNVNVSKAQSLFEEVKKAAEKDDSDKVTELTREINENLMKILPRYIAKEMRDAKADLREIKMMNVDIGKPVDILKQANNSVQDGDYSAALHAIKDFKDFMEKMK